MKTTVIVPNFNGNHYLEPCLDSLLSQQILCTEESAGKEESVFHVIVVDNGSTDGSVELLQKKYPDVELIALSENTGFCHAVNVGIRASKTPFVILLNNDTVVMEKFVENLEKAIERSERIFSVSARMLSMKEPDRMDDGGDRYCVLGWAYGVGKGRPASAYEKPAVVFSACGGAAIYRRELLMGEVGLFDELHFAYLEDLDVGYRANILGYRNLYEPSARVLHAGSAASGSRYNSFKTKHSSANNAYVIAKNMPLFQFLWNLPFLLAGFTVKLLFFAGKGMGGEYLRGYLRGIARSFTPEGRARKVPFHWKNLSHYLRIQGLLYLDLLRMFF